MENAVAEHPCHVKCHRSLLFSPAKETDQGTPVHPSLQDLGPADNEEAVEETKEAEGDQGEQKCLRKGGNPLIGVLRY